MRPAIDAQGLSQRYRTAFALQPLDLVVAPGERLAVLGGNGAGKTTLLRLLATVDRPATGSLLLFGLDSARQRSLLRPRLAFLGHQSGLYPALSARENLELFCTLHRLPALRAREMLAKLSLERRENLRAGDLSRGEQQRLGLARSLLHDPELWLLDEPDAGLDEAGRRLLDSLAAERTVVLATHNRRLAASLCGRAVELDQGRLLDAPRLEVMDASR